MALLFGGCQREENVNIYSRPQQDGLKTDGKRDDFRLLVASLPEHVRDEFFLLWEEYEAGSSREARIAKAMDKIETLLQHNQGQNPASFDYTFNLKYGRTQTEAVPLARRIRTIVDRETAHKAYGPHHSPDAHDK